MIKSLKSLVDVWNKCNFIFTRKQKRNSMFVFLLTLIGAGFETLGVSIIVPLVQAMVSSDQLMNSKTLSSIISFFHIQTVNQLIMLMCMAVVCVYLIKNAYLALLSYARVRFSSTIMRELSVRIMQSYMNRGYSFFLNTNTSELMRGVSADVSGVYNILYQIFKIFAETLTALCICIFIFFTDWVMALSVVIMAGICLFIILFGFKNKMRIWGEKYRDYTALTGKHSLQAFQGIKEILVMHRQKYFIGSYENAYIKQQKSLIGQTVGAESPTYIIEAICVSGLIVAVGFRIVNGTDTTIFIPKLAAFAIAAFRILPSLGRISSSFNSFIYSCPSLNATYSNLWEVKQFEEKNYKKDKMDTIAKASFNSKIEIRNIKWHYPNSNTNVLDGLNMEICKGKSVAFIGQSGAGKSTLADIILGLLKPQLGQILVDEVDINLIPEQWSRMIGYVPQTVYLTDDTIRNNVAFGINKDEISDELIWSALEQAQIKEFVETLPKGLDTLVGERGVRFSGGQRQRIAIARALYYNPDILVLDEATSALDNETETAVMSAIDALQGKKTLIIVAHRLTTIINCDEIYEINEKQAILRRKQEVLNH